MTLQLLGALGTFAAGIMTAWVVQQFRARAEHRHWLRQQRLEAYAAFVAAMDAMDRLTSRWSVSWAKPDEPDQIERYYDGLEAMSRAAGRVHLLADSSLIAACVMAQRHWDLEMQAGLRLKDHVRLLNGYPEANRLYNDVVREARAELGRPKAPLTKEDAERLDKERQFARGLDDTQRPVA